MYLGVFKSSIRTDVTQCDITIESSDLSGIVTSVPISIVLDAGSTPVAAGVPIIALLGYILRRRLGGTLEGLPVEWGGT